MSGVRIALILSVIMIVGCAGRDTRSAQDVADASEAYARLGLQYLQSEELASAKKAFQKSLELNPREAGALDGLGLVFQLEQEPVLAERYFKQAIDVAPESARIHNNYGAFLFAQGRYADACSELSRATEDPFYNRRAQAFENLGRCYINIERLEAAEHALQRALQLSSGRPVALVEMAGILLEQQRFSDAELYFERFTALVEQKRVKHYARSLWIGIQMARQRGDSSGAAAYGLILKNLYPASAEYRQYEESTH